MMVCITHYFRKLVLNLKLLVFYRRQAWLDSQSKAPSQLSRWLQHAVLVLCLACVPLAHATDIDITQAVIESTDDGYRLSSSYAFQLNSGLEDALMHSVPLYFTTEVRLTRQRWYWFDEVAVSTSRTIRISFNVLTRRYHAAITGHLQQGFDSLEDVLAMIRRPPRWIIASPNELTKGDAYNVSVRMYLDVAQLPKPFQINALNNNDWNLSSNWQEFTFTPE